MELDVFLERVYAEVSDNIKFSEMKNATLITLNSALIAWGGSIVCDSGIFYINRAMIALFVLLLFIPTICSTFSFRAKINPESKLIKRIYSCLDSKNIVSATPPKFMYYAYIHKYYINNPDKYLRDISSDKLNYENNMYSLQVVQQIIDLSSIAYRKFTLFNYSVKIECGLFSFGVIVAFVSLFIESLIR